MKKKKSYVMGEIQGLNSEEMGQAIHVIEENYARVKRNEKKNTARDIERYAP